MTHFYPNFSCRTNGLAFDSGYSGVEKSSRSTQWLQGDQVQCSAKQTRNHPPSPPCLTVGVSCLWTNVAKGHCSRSHCVLLRHIFTNQSHAVMIFLKRGDFLQATLPTKTEQTILIQCCFFFVVWPWGEFGTMFSPGRLGTILIFFPVMNKLSHCQIVWRWPLCPFWIDGQLLL